MPGGLVSSARLRSRNSSHCPICRNNMRVLAADLLEIRVLVKVTHRVAAEKRKRLRICQLIPERFKTDRRLLLTVLPEHVHHLAIDADGAIRSLAARRLDDVAHAFPECLGLGL